MPFAGAVRSGRCGSSSPKTRRSSGSTCAGCSKRRVTRWCGEARDGEEAVALARRLEPDLAIMDVKMPRLDGIEAARQILAERPIPIVMVTAFDQQELVARAVEAGVFGYLVKPFREHDLVPAIETARARHEELVAVPSGGGARWARRSPRGRRSSARRVS